MRWLPSISFLPASSSSTSTTPLKSPSDGESPNDSNNNNNNNNNSSSSGSGSSSKRSEEVGSGTWRFGPIRRLTRQRKLRHLSDNDVVGVSAGSITLEPLSLTRSPSMASRSATTSEAKPQPQPQPLPLPELGIFRAKERPVPDFVNVPLPSPKTAQSRVVEDRDRDRDRDRASSSISPIKSVFARRDTKGGIDYGEKRSYRRELPEQNCSESSRDDFRVHVPMRSAPNSPFSSPVLSPHRASTGDSFPYYYYMIPKGNQVWSAPEIPTTAMIPGFPPPAFFDYNTFSSDTSPLHSPRAKCPQQFPKSQSGPASPLNCKLFIETSTVRRESSCPVNVHPLPLPPGAATPSPCTTTPNPIPTPPTPPPQPIVKLESVPMNSQWNKGKLIGRGTFGSVYVATNRETGALCAMKEVEIFPDDPKSAESIKQLQQEIKVLSQLKHPNIVQYYGSEIVDDRFFIYLEYVHPGSINKYVREHCGAITESVVRNFTRHILSGLAYLHSTKTIHRDIKGANLLVDSSGVVKLADFGMAKHLTGQAADLSLKGSPYWMAPELMQAVMQRDSNSDLALAVDIWSLGCTIIEMFTGKPPWSDFEGAAAMFKVMRDTPPIPETLSSEGKDFLRCCFQRNPAERSSAAMLLEHRFLKNSQQLDVPSCNPAFNGKNSTEKPHSPRERSENKCDQLPRFPSTPIAKEKLASESDTGQQSHHETSDLTVASRYSGRLLTFQPVPPPRKSPRSDIIKRERAMAYAYSHQLWKATPKSTNTPLADIRSGGFPWWWNWLERQQPPANPPEGQAMKSFQITPPRPVSEMKPSPWPQSSNHKQNPFGFDIMDTPTPKSTRSTIVTSAKQARTPPPHRNPLANSSSLSKHSRPRASGASNSPFDLPLKDDDSLMSCPPFSVPNYMVPTVSAKAKARAYSNPKERFPGTPSSTESKRRLSFPLTQGIGSFKWNKGSLFSNKDSSSQRMLDKDQSLQSVGNLSVDSTVSLPAGIGRKPFNRFV